MNEETKMAQENFRIAMQELQVAVRRCVDASDEITAIFGRVSDNNKELIADAIQDQEFKNGEERKEVEDND